MAVLCDAGRVLLCHRSPTREWMPGVWDFPGGHIDPGETPQQALVRELVEELGVRIATPNRDPDVVLDFDEVSTRVAVWFIAYEGTVENRRPDEHDDLRWITFEDATQLELADTSYLGLIEQALDATPHA